MTDSSNGNGCYVLIAERKFPIAKSLASALEQLLLLQENKTGKITLHIKNGGLSAAEINTIFVE